MVWLGGVLTACSGNTTSSNKDEGTSMDADPAVDGSGTGDNGAGHGATGHDTANATGAALTTGGTAEETANSTGTTPAAEGTGQDTANAAGATPTGGGTGQDAENSTDVESTSDCDERCDPCPAGQRRYDCTGTCLCESIDDSARDEQEQLLTCNWAIPCGGAALWVTANAGSPIYDISGVECLFSALRDRTPGRYDFTYQALAGFSVDYTSYVILLDGSDTIQVLRSGYFGGPAPINALQLFHINSVAPPADSILDACLADPAGCGEFTDWLNFGTDTTAASCPGEG